MASIDSAMLNGLLFGLFLAISVGPTLFALIKYSLHYSYKAGIAFVIGVSVSDIIYVVIANAATSFLLVLKTYEKPLAIALSILVIGAGIVGLLNKKKSVNIDFSEQTIMSKTDTAKIFASGFLINTLNPAVAINWLGAAAVIATKNLSYKLIFFTSCLGLIISIDLLKVLLSSKIKSKLTPSTVEKIQKISSLILLLIGLGILIIAIFGSFFS
ncbi:MAG: LysE family transporter [Bacteroidota bacterium]|jgi:threonine/homoserine/homoserine lactone efflux protein|nr:LysE family transporter [Bacteroidota bacterium]